MPRKRAPAQELPPEPPVDFLIVTALPEERDALMAKLPGSRKLDKTEADIHTFYAARVKTRREDWSEYSLIVTCLVKMGPITATAQTVSVVRRWRPRYVLLVGIACGVRGSVHHGDILIASQVADYTIGKQEDAARKINWDVYPCGVSLLDSATNLADSWRNGIGEVRPGPGEPVLTPGVVASGGDVIKDDEIIAAYSQSWPKLVGIEMESGGVAAGVHHTPDRPEFLMIKGVSDFGKDKHDPEVIPWRKYACHAAAAFAIDLMKSGPSPSVAVTSTGAHGKGADEKRRDGERQWDYLLTHPFRRVRWLFLLKTDVGRALFDKMIHETNLTFDHHTVVRLSTLVSAAAREEQREGDDTRDEDIRLWQIYQPEPGYWVSRRGPDGASEDAVVAGVSGSAPWSSLGLKDLDVLQDLSRFSEIGLSLPPIAFQAGIAEFELTFGGDTFSFTFSINDNGVLDVLHSMAWTAHQEPGEKKRRGEADVFAVLGTGFAGGQLLDKFHKQWMQRWIATADRTEPFKGEIGRCGPTGKNIYFYPREPKSFRGSAEEKEYVFTIPGTTHEAIAARIVELEKETREGHPEELLFVELAYRYWAQGRLVDAMEVVRRAEKAGRSGRDLLRIWGQILKSMGRYPEAIERMERAVSLDSGCAETRMALAIVLSDAGRKKDAVPEFRKALEMEPTNREFQRNLGLGLAQADEETDEAISLLERATASTPEDAPALAGLGRLLEKAGRPDEAFRHFERATLAQGADSYAFAELGLYHARMRNYAAAIQAFERAVELKKDPQLYDFLGGCYAPLDRIEEAEKAFREGHRLDPDNQGCLAKLGAVLARRGELEEARQLLERAVELDPTDDISKTNLKTIVRMSKGKCGWLKRLGILR